VETREANKGAAGVDGLDIAGTGQHLKHAWPTIRQQLMEGTYRPKPVRRVGIPKPDGSERELGIPTVTDRLIQQALLQVLQPLIDPTFSEHSRGFRPGRRARDAVLAAQQHVQDGYRVVVDVDLSKFFDRVNHDILIDRLRKRVSDAGVIRLVRAYLNAGIMDGGVVVERAEGTPRKAARSRRCWPMCFSTKWIVSWNEGAIASPDTPMIVMCTCAVRRPASE
jgi:group II intron reverse transcriptase/maturase